MLTIVLGISYRRCPYVIEEAGCRTGSLTMKREVSAESAVEAAAEK
jgi:hypothetical protein